MLAAGDEPGNCCDPPQPASIAAAAQQANASRRNPSSPSCLAPLNGLPPKKVRCSPLSRLGFGIIGNGVPPIAKP